MEDNKSFTSLAEMGTIMDTISKTPKDFENNKEALDAAIDNKKMMEAIAKYKAAHTTLVKENDIKRNDPCPCGSGKKYKNCCLNTGKYNRLVPKK